MILTLIKRVVIKDTHILCLVPKGQTKLKILSWHLISNFNHSNLVLDQRHLGGNIKLLLDISYRYFKIRVNRPKQTSFLVEIEFLLLASLSFSSTLITDIWVAFLWAYWYKLHTHTKFGINKPHQTEVIMWKVNVYFKQQCPWPLSQTQSYLLI